MSGTLIEVILPISLFIIMLGMGMTLVTDDFKRILIYPKAVSIGIIGQLILLPLVGFAIATSFPMTPELAVGIMILAACPGGVTSNVIAHLAKGDTALSITLTAISSVITVVSIPLIISFSLNHFAEAGQVFNLPVKKTMATLFVITILPVSIGMLVKAKASQFADSQERRFNYFATVFFIFLVVLIVYTERENLLNAVQLVGVPTLLLNLGMMLVGYVLARIAWLDARQTKTITLEIGIQNTTLAFVIVGSILSNPTYALPAAIYSLFMYLSSGAFILYSKKQSATNSIQVNA